MINFPDVISSALGIAGRHDLLGMFTITDSSKALEKDVNLFWSYVCDYVNQVRRKPTSSKPQGTCKKRAYVKGKVVYIEKPRFVRDKTSDNSFRYNMERAIFLEISECIQIDPDIKEHLLLLYDLLVVFQCVVPIFVLDERQQQLVKIFYRTVSNYCLGYWKRLKSTMEDVADSISDKIEIFSDLGKSFQKKAISNIQVSVELLLLHCYLLTPAALTTDKRMVVLRVGKLYSTNILSADKRKKMVLETLREIREINSKLYLLYEYPIAKYDAEYLGEIIAFFGSKIERSYLQQRNDVVKENLCLYFPYEITCCDIYKRWIICGSYNGVVIIWRYDSKSVGRGKEECILQLDPGIKFVKLWESFFVVAWENKVSWFDLCDGSMREVNSWEPVYGSKIELINEGHGDLLAFTVWDPDSRREDREIMVCCDLGRNRIDISSEYLHDKKISALYVNQGDLSYGDVDGCIYGMVIRSPVDIRLPHLAPVASIFIFNGNVFAYSIDGIGIEGMPRLSLSRDERLTKIFRYENIMVREIINDNSKNIKVQIYPVYSSRTKDMGDDFSCCSFYKNSMVLCRIIPQTGRAVSQVSVRYIFIDP